jgi:hypothetical protein
MPVSHNLLSLYGCLTTATALQLAIARLVPQGTGACGAAGNLDHILILCQTLRWLAQQRTNDNERHFGLLLSVALI